MKGFEQHNNDAQCNVGVWTLQQCKDYLDKYPNGLKAEQVRTRMAYLEKDKKDKKDKKRHTDKPTQNVVQPSAPTQKKPNDVNTSNKAGDSFGKFLLSVLVIGGGIGLYWLLSDVIKSHTLLVALVFGGIVPALKQIWK